MNEKLQYASMLEIPVNTCNITYKPVKARRTKRKKSVSAEEIKGELVRKVNAVAEKEAAIEAYAEAAIKRGETAEALPKDNENVCADIDKRDAYGGAADRAVNENRNEAYNSSMAGKAYLQMQTGRDNAVRRKDADSRPRRKRGISAIGVEIAVIGALIAVIFLTSAFYPQSGVGAFMKSVFGATEAIETVDERTYAEFSPVIRTAADETLSVEDGAVTIGGKGSVYSPLGGVVKTITADGNGRFDIEIAHSEKFSTVISGVDYAYAAVGDEVYGNIPIGYVLENGVKMCFMAENGAAITGYELDGNAVVWAV